jgi:integrase
MSRRPNGQGSVYRRQDGRWVAQLPYPGARRRWLYARTKQEAYAKLARALREREQGVPIPDERLTVAEFLLRWVEEVARPSVRPGTYVSYERLVRVHLIPELGHFRLSHLAPAHVQAALNGRLASGQSPANVAHMRVVLRRALTVAERWGLVARNVAALTDPPKVPRFEARPLSPAEARTFLTSIEDDPLRAMWVLALLTGLRRGELLGLSWEDVNLEAAQLTVHRQLLRIRVGLRRWRCVVAELKSASGRRQVALPSLAVEALRTHRQRQVEARLTAGPAWVGSPLGDLVFTTGIGTPLDPDRVTKLAKQALTHAGFADRRLHDLRSTYGSLLNDQGVPLKTVSALMGHATIKVTADTYIGVMDHAGRQAAAGLDRLLRRGA